MKVARLVVTMALVVLAGAARAADPVPLYKAGVEAKKAGDLALAEGKFRACLEADPKFGRCHFSLGVLLKKKDLLDEAERHFRAAVAAHPTWGQAQLSLGMTLLKLERPAEARAALDKALVDPELEVDDRAEGWNAIGVMERKAERYKEAVAAYDKAIAAVARGSFFHHKAIALMHLGELVAAEAALRRSLELAPDDAQAKDLLTRVVAMRQKEGAKP